MLFELGLELNSAKCKFIVLGRPSNGTRAELVEGCKPSSLESETPLVSLTLLGTPLNETGIQAASDIAAANVPILDRIRTPDTHTAVIFLTHHVSAPRLQYLPRSRGA